MQNMNKAAIITINDACALGQKEDTSGNLLINLLNNTGFEVISKIIISSDTEQIEKHLNIYSANENLSLIITIGGTGIGNKDFTPEITKKIIEKEVPGISELIRLKMAEDDANAFLTRIIAGIKNKILIINFPGRIKAVEKAFEAIKDILPNAISQIKA